MNDYRGFQVKSKYLMNPLIEPLFDRNVIDREILNVVPYGFVLRPLEITDYEKGYLQVLSQLTVVGEVSRSDFVERFSYLKAHNHEYFAIVIEDLNKSRIVGAGTIFMERKFIHNLGQVGHLEDVVTHNEYRGMHFGILIMQALASIGQRLGAYKSILDCTEKNGRFYEARCNFKFKELQMVRYYGQEKTAPLLLPITIKPKLWNV